MSTVESTTAICRSGRPFGNASSACTNRGKLSANTVCLSSVCDELSITSRMSSLLVRSTRLVTVGGGALSVGGAVPT